MLQQKTTVIDLNSLLSCGDILLSLIRRSTVDEQRTNSLFANSRFYSKASIQNLRKSLQRQLSSKIFFMFRPISDNGFRSINIPRKPERYRNLLKMISDNQKRAEVEAFTTRNTPNSKHPAFRENLAKTSTYGKLLYF